ncbi:hypothetical protein BHC47_01505 [Snodgrassella alvi]|uniref:Uncharacterized protein n=1 Tax=Snodgrassella alvi TaxID=1196083 RepID=A0A2N9Y1P6_9NEIS|nr:hypothetical protein [Snodgrassella alvi]PIT60566.1 hypothetical protein BHC47_01505 [Snodgrassella alvi]PIT61420.1 hypothetical protein BHC56_08200 [Snodgrassella alvi]
MVILWQEQDLDLFAKLKFIQSDKDRVKVIIDATERFEEHSVTYQVICQNNNDCKITDIFESGKFSQKINMVYHTVKKAYKKKIPLQLGFFV